MPIRLSLDDFKLTRAVCEIRYEPAYLIYDHTGRIAHDVQRSFTNVSVISAAPNQSAFSADEGSFGLELTQSRLTTDNPEASLQDFGTLCKKYFQLVAEYLDIDVFSRIGLRVFYKKNHSSRDLSREALGSLNLVNQKQVPRFAASEHLDEVLLRWEGPQVGALLRLKAETGTIDVVLPPELEAPDPKMHKSLNALLIDVDYYTVAPVELAQWDAAVWIPQTTRTIKKEVNALLEG